MLELLISIKGDKTLITEFLDLDSPSLRATLENTEEESDTFFGDDLTLSENITAAQNTIEEESQSDTFFGTEFDLGSAPTQDDIHSLKHVPLGFLEQRDQAMVVNVLKAHTFDLL